MSVILIEGIDHSFKSTFANNILCEFKQYEIDSILIKFPEYDKPSGMKINKILHGDGANKDKLPELFHKEQIDAIDRIREYSNQGKVVILDRFFLSNIAYNYHKLDISEIEHSFNNLIDYTVYIDMDTDLIKDAIKNRAKQNNEELDIHESDIDYLKNVRINYLKYILTKSITNDSILGKIIIVDAYNGNKLNTPEEMKSIVKNLVKNIKNGV